MSYASVQDVEDRLGYTLDEAEAKRVQFFLDDASTSLDFALSNVNIDPTTIPDALKLSLVASKGVQFAEMMDINPYLTSWSQSDDGAAEAKSFRVSSRANLLNFNRSDFKFLGIKTFKFSSFTTEYKWGEN